MDDLNIVTYNVRGLGNYTKRREVFHYLHTKQIDIAFLQETHSCSKTEHLWSNQWGSKIRFSHGKSDARGVAIMFNRNLNVQIHNIITDIEGRYVLTHVSLYKSGFLFAFTQKMKTIQISFRICSETLNGFHPIIRS